MPIVWIIFFQIFSLVKYYLLLKYLRTQKSFDKNTKHLKANYLGYCLIKKKGMKLKGSDYLRWLYNVYTFANDQLSKDFTIFNYQKKPHWCWIKIIIFGLFKFFCVKDISDFAICTYQSDTISKKLRTTSILDHN